MIPIHQTRFGKDGNCFQACLASVLERPLESVPDFCQEPGDGAWWDLCRHWLREQGFIGVLLYPDDSDPRHLEATLSGLIHIASGKTIRSSSLLHATVWFGGKLVFDPHPKKHGLARVEDTIFLIPMRPELVRLVASPPDLKPLACSLQPQQTQERT